jgi:hypothetical protein
MWGFELVNGFIGHSQFLITIIYGAIANSHTRQFTTAHTESSQSAVIYQCSGTFFERRMLPFLGSRTVPVPQPKQFLTRSTLIGNLLELPPLVTGYVLQ